MPFCNCICTGKNRPCRNDCNIKRICTVKRRSDARYPLCQRDDNSGNYGGSQNIANYKLTIDDYLDLMAMWYRDVLVFKSTKDSNALIFKDEMSLLAEQAKNCSYEGLEDILKSIDKVKLRLKANVNFDLVIELLIMAIKEAM